MTDAPMSPQYAALLGALSSWLAGSAIYLMTKRRDWRWRFWLAVPAGVAALYLFWQIVRA
jgi:hypothetical protein